MKGCRHLGDRRPAGRRWHPERFHVAQPGEGRRPPHGSRAGTVPSRRPLGPPTWHVEVLLCLRFAQPWSCALCAAGPELRRAGLAVLPVPP